jgi:hypothetical protein
MIPVIAKNTNQALNLLICDPYGVIEIWRVQWRTVGGSKRRRASISLWLMVHVVPTKLNTAPRRHMRD